MQPVNVAFWHRQRYSLNRLKVAAAHWLCLASLVVALTPAGGSELFAASVDTVDVRDIARRLQSSTSYLLSHRDASNRINAPLKVYGYIGTPLLMDSLDIVGAFASHEKLGKLRPALLRSIIAQQSSDGGFPSARGKLGGRTNTRLIVETLRMQREKLRQSSATIPLSLGRDLDAAIAASERFLASGAKGPDNPLVVPLSIFIRGLQQKAPLAELLAKASAPLTTAAASNEDALLKYAHGILVQMLPAIALIQKQLAAEKRPVWLDQMFPQLQRLDEESSQQLVERVLEQQEPEGSWLGNILGTSIALLALHGQGYALDHPLMDKALAFIQLQFFKGRQDDEIVVSFFAGDTWLTSATGEVLLETPTRVSVDPDRRIVEALRNVIIADHIKGGGWAFGGRSTTSDADCTSVPLRFLAKAPLAKAPGLAEAHRRAMAEAIAFSWSVQNDDGGFSSFKKSAWSNPRGKPGMLRSVLLDISHPDVAAKLLDAFSVAGETLANPNAARIWKFLQGAQQSFGGWWGRWFSGYLSTTAMTISGAVGIGIPLDDPAMQRAISFLRKTQHSDGGWGETTLTDSNQEYIGKGSSTAAQSALVILGLMDALGDKALQDRQVQRGIAYLASTQRPNGGYADPYPVYTVFPGHTYYDYPVLTTANTARVFARYVSLRERAAGGSSTFHNDQPQPNAAAQR